MHPVFILTDFYKLRHSTAPSMDLRPVTLRSGTEVCLTTVNPIKR